MEKTMSNADFRLCAVNGNANYDEFGRQILTDDELLELQDIYGSHWYPKTREDALEYQRTFLKQEEKGSVQSRKTSRTGANSPKHDVAVKAARSTARANDWPALTGTTKQKRWAEQIRAAMLPRIEDENLRLVAADAFRAAKFWIDNRESFNTVLSSALDELRKREKAIAAYDAAVRAEQARAANAVAAAQAEVSDRGITSETLMARITALGLMETAWEDRWAGDRLAQFPDGTRVFRVDGNRLALKRTDGTCSLSETRADDALVQDVRLLGRIR